MSDILAEGANFTLEISGRVATARIFRRLELGPAELEQAAQSLSDLARDLLTDPRVDGLVIDLRRTAGAAGPEVERIYGAIAAEWETTAQPIAFLVVAETIQALQTARIVSANAPRFGMVSSLREQAHAYAGAGVTPSRSTHSHTWAGRSGIGTS
jgi:hypothetical protein